MKKLVYANLFDTKYRELYNGATINIKRKKDDINTIVTIDKGRKEYLLPTKKLEVLQLIQDLNLTNKELIFLNDDFTYSKNRVRLNDAEILEQLTPLGQKLYLHSEYGKEVIESLNAMF